MKRARQQARRRRDARRSTAVSRLRRRANARLTAQTSPQDAIKLLKSTVQQAEARIWLSQQRLEQLALKERDELAAARLRNTVLEEELRQSNARQALLRDELGAACDAPGSSSAAVGSLASDGAPLHLCGPSVAAFWRSAAHAVARVGLC